MGRDGNGLGLIFIHECFRVLLGFIEQADLVRGDLLAAGRVATGQRQVELLLKGENPGAHVLVLLLELLVVSGLFSDQRL